MRDYRLSICAKSPRILRPTLNNATIGCMTSILVTGASGLFGGEVVRQLSAKGVPFRILVRESSVVPDLGACVETAVGDYRDFDSLVAAMQGIEKLFLVARDYPETVEHQANVLKAAKQCGVRHVIRLSSDGTDENRNLPIFFSHYESEQQLKASGLEFTLLKPMWVMQNFESFVVDDCLRLPSGDGRIGLIDHRDVAALAVEALTDSGHEGKSYILASESLSHAQVAEQLTEALGRKISYIDTSPEDYRHQLEAEGWDEYTAESMIGIFAEVQTGANSDTNVPDTVLEFLGRPGIRFRQYASDYASVIGKPS
jgi:uncharacterized protein YbjT (DUF2867 family)